MVSQTLPCRLLGSLERTWFYGTTGVVRGKIEEAADNVRRAWILSHGFLFGVIGPALVKITGSFILSGEIAETTPLESLVSWYLCILGRSSSTSPISSREAYEVHDAGSNLVSETVEQLADPLPAENAPSSQLLGMAPMC